MKGSLDSNFKISVILPVYNVEKYLRRCLDSIISQTMDQDDYEVIMVDDGAKDASPAICDEYSAKHENFIVIHQPNGGAAAARNAGLCAANGEYVVFVDPDDYIEPDYLQVAYNTAKDNQADIALFDAIRENNVTKDGKYICNMIMSGGQTTSEKQSKIKGAAGDLWNHAPKAFVTSDSSDILSMQCQILYPYMAAKAGDVSFTKDIPLSAPWDKCFRRAFLIEKRLQFPKDLKVLDDMSFNFVVFKEAGKIAYTPKPLYHYCIEPNSITNSYKENRPELDIQVFEFLKKNIRSCKGMSQNDEEKISGMDRDTCNDQSDIMQAYYARIIKSFAICCRLCFFNDKNPKSSKERLHQVRTYMDAYPYKDAFLGIRMKNIDYKLKAVAVAGRLKSPRMLRFLDWLQNK